MKVSASNMIVLAVLAIIIVLFANTMCKEKYGPIKSLRNIPNDECDRMCDTIYHHVQHSGRGMGPDLAYNRTLACKRTCRYSDFQRVHFP